MSRGGRVRRQASCHQFRVHIPVKSAMRPVISGSFEQLSGSDRLKRPVFTRRRCRRARRLRPTQSLRNRRHQTNDRQKQCGCVRQGTNLRFGPAGESQRGTGGQRWRGSEFYHGSAKSENPLLSLTTTGSTLARYPTLFCPHLVWRPGIVASCMSAPRAAHTGSSTPVDLVAYDRQKFDSCSIRIQSKTYQVNPVRGAATGAIREKNRLVIREDKGAWIPVACRV